MNTPPIWQIYNIPPPASNFQSAPIQPMQTEPTQAIPAMGAGLSGATDMSHPFSLDFGGGQDMSQGVDESQGKTPKSSGSSAMDIIKPLMTLFTL